MRFTVEIGDKERSRIEVYRNWFTGTFHILADDKVVAQRRPLSLFTHFNVQMVRRYEFVVGHMERHNVVVTHERPIFVAGLRPQTYRVFVNGQLVHEQSGY
jgi:hypothetical protein